MTTEYIHTYSEEVKQLLMESCDSGKVCIEISDGNAQSFVGVLLLLSDKWVRMLESTTLVAYTAHIIFLNLSAGIGQKLIENVLTLTECIPVCCTQAHLKE